MVAALEWNSPLLSGYSSSPSPTMAGGPRLGPGEDESTRKRQVSIPGRRGVWDWGHERMSEQAIQMLQVRLLKNREAAKECRRKKKVSIRGQVGRLV